MWQLFKRDHYLILEDIVYTHNFEIDATIEGVAFNQVNTVYLWLITHKQIYSFLFV